ncbi:MAG TPA: nitronate monooxygenase, partial [Aquabacterium sp.]|nr:nitronate monooxygenase [Aquabacterium sp.]
ARIQALGGAAVQLGTPFAVATEGDASEGFKRVLAGAREQDMLTFTSVAGLPARAVATPWLVNYLKAEPALQAKVHTKGRCTQAFDCLAQCGLRDGLPGWGQFCIDQQLANALRGDPKKGLYFRGAGDLPFGDQIRPVRALIEHLLRPAAAAAPADADAALALA